MAATRESLTRTQHVNVPSNRAFGCVFAGVFLVVSLWPVFSGSATRIWALAVSGPLMLVTLTIPAALTIANRVWQRFGALLHRIMSPIVLAVMFYALVTPMGVLMRLFGKDSLRLRDRGSADTFWITRSPPGPLRDSMPRQF